MSKLNVSSESVSTYINARGEAMNGLFQAACERVRIYRNTEIFKTMTYWIASSAGETLEPA